MPTEKSSCNYKFKRLFNVISSMQNKNLRKKKQT